MLLISFVFVAACTAQQNSFHHFPLYSRENNISITDYAIKLGYKHFDYQFNKFKFDNSKKYESNVEEQERKLNFLVNTRFVDDHNRLFKDGKVSHQVGINAFSDLGPEELYKMFSMPEPLPLRSEKSKGIAFNANLPQSLDWRQKGKVTPVKNQGSCGSCWAFTTVAMIESGYAIHYNQSLSLAEQQLVDCMNSHCKGQQITKGLEYVVRNGLQTSTDYPYKAKADICKNKPVQFHAHIKRYGALGKAAAGNPATDAQIMSALVNRGPIGFVLEVSGKDFLFYRSGVLSTGIDTSMGWKSVHSMVIVGWGSANGTDYWIAKNSWGSGWGEQGYIRLVRGKAIRGMNHYLYYPEF